MTPFSGMRRHDDVRGSSRWRMLRVCLHRVRPPTRVLNYELQQGIILGGMIVNNVFERTPGSHLLGSLTLAKWISR